jgi:phosphate transport system substrate-binding protein
LTFDLDRFRATAGTWREAASRLSAASSRRELLALAIAGLLPSLCFAAGTPGSLRQPVYPAYKPQRSVGGTIRIWGHGGRDRSPAGALVQAWVQGFQRFHPQVSFEVTLRGQSTAIGGLYTGAADVALMERPPSAIELDGYRPIFGHDPFGVTVATGSLANVGHALAPVVFVHQRNPLSRLTLAQLDALIGADARRGHPLIKVWGELGADGQLRDQPVQVLTYELASELPQYIQNAVMGGSQKWRGALREFCAPTDTRSQETRSCSRQLMQTLSETPNALAVATWPERGAQAKAVALSATADGPFMPPTRESIAQRRYPLIRDLQVYVDRVPGKPVAQPVGEFLSYLLSAPGQMCIAKDGGYFALPAQEAARVRETLA